VVINSQLRIILLIREDEEEKTGGSREKWSWVHGQFWESLLNTRIEEATSWSVYNEIDVDWYSLSIFDNYVNNDSINDDGNGGNDNINGVFINKLEVGCKKT